MKTIFLDVETTGVEETDRLVQVAFKLNGDYYDSLYKPPVPMGIDAMSICHITNEMLEDVSPFIGSEEFTLLNEEFSHPEAVFVAHNAQFDMKFMAKEGVKLPVKHICTLKIANHYDKDALLGKYNLQYLRYYYALKFEQKINPHDALSDIIVLEKLFEFYNKFYTIEEMIDISSKPILLKKMMFGKYKDMWFKDIARQDMSYMRWMKAFMEMDENMRYTVNYYIENI